MNLENYFKKDKIIKNITIYEASYQIALGKLLNLYGETPFNNELELQYILGSIYEVLKEFEFEELKEELIEKEIQKQASMDLLQDFVNLRLEDVKTNKIQVEKLVNEINDNEFFNTTMTKVYKENFSLIEEKYKTIITEELAQAILDSLKGIIKPFFIFYNLS